MRVYFVMTWTKPVKRILVLAKDKADVRKKLGYEKKYISTFYCDLQDFDELIFRTADYVELRP